MCCGKRSIKQYMLLYETFGVVILLSMFSIIKRGGGSVVSSLGYRAESWGGFKPPLRQAAAVGALNQGPYPSVCCRGVPYCG